MQCSDVNAVALLVFFAAAARAGIIAAYLGFFAYGLGGIGWRKLGFFSS